MSYELEWLDENLSLLVLRVYDPLSAGEAKEIIAKMRQISEAPRPFFVLLDLQQFDPMQSVSVVREALEGEALPPITSHLENSRAAVLGGGPMVNLGFQFLQSMSSLDLARAFKREDEALTWLQDQARFAAASPSSGSTA